ncbi:NPC intracellular cholesterol transporter 2 [Drosophila madeirensis]|uniref:NPC intracellular cholesterol transporter 2 n=1 Tax=Drosophila madeirensis TaxID=30013 RepID=A0AAU9FAM9_DROMD
MSNIKKVCLCLMLSLAWTLISADTPIRRCADSSIPLPLMVQINECDTLPCDLWKGSEAKIDIQFVATRNTMKQLTAEVRLTSLGVTLPYDLEAKRGNVCQNLLHGAYCPLDAGEDVTYELLLPVEPTQLEVPTRLEVRLLDVDNGNQVVSCFVTDTRVKKPNSL